MSSSAADATANELLASLLRSTDPAQGDSILADLIFQHAQPLARRIAASKLGGATTRQDVEDVTGQVVVDLLSRLRATVEGGQLEPIQDLSRYVAVLTYHACHEYLRQKFPQRHKLKNRIRYYFGVDARIAAWQSGEGEWLCGLAGLKGRTDATPCPPPQVLLEKLPAGLGGRLRSALPTDVLYALLKPLGSPILLDTFVDALAHLWDVKDQAVSADCGQQIPADRVPVDLELERRENLAQLWQEIQKLPVPQRAALLLNLRDGEGGSPIMLLPVVNVATMREIAATLEMPALDLARLWKDLPLDDLAIAARLQVTRQQVINLRKSARQRLMRCLGWLAGSR